MDAGFLSLFQVLPLEESLGAGGVFKTDGPDGVCHFLAARSVLTHQASFGLLEDVDFTHGYQLSSLTKIVFPL